MIRQRQHKSIPMRMRPAFVPGKVLNARNFHPFVIDENPHLLPRPTCPRQSIETKTITSLFIVRVIYHDAKILGILVDQRKPQQRRIELNCGGRRTKLPAVNPSSPKNLLLFNKDYLSSRYYLSRSPPTSGWAGFKPLRKRGTTLQCPNRPKKNCGFRS
jgi:hypothetical protein